MNDTNDQQPVNKPEEPELPPLADQKFEPLQPTSQPPLEQSRLPKFKLSRQFVAGFLGWFLVNGLTWIILNGGTRIDPNDEAVLIYNGLFFFPLNVLVLIILSIVRKTRQVAGGILAALGANLLISLILGLVYNAVCLIPFFFGEG